MSRSKFALARGVRLAARQRLLGACLVVVAGVGALTAFVLSRQNDGVTNYVTPLGNVADRMSAERDSRFDLRSRPLPTQPSATAVDVHGRVIDSRDGAVPDAEVVLTSAKGTTATRTRRDGTFVVKHVTPGSYVLRASKATFPTRHYGQSDTNDIVQTVEVKDATKSDALILRLTGGGVVAGVVTDEYGEPVVGASVGAVPHASAVGLPGAFYSLIQGKLPVALDADTRTSLTNDRGEYRIYGLRPGQYRIVMTRNAGIRQMESSTPTDSFPVYFPGTHDIALASVVRVTTESEAHATFTTSVAQAVVIAGEVVNSTGQRVPGASVRIMRTLKGEPWLAAPSITSATDSAGIFSASVLPDRDYIIYASDRRPWASPGVQAEVELGAASVRAGTRGVSGIRIATQRGATISGKIIGVPREDAVTLRVTPVPLDSKARAAAITASAPVNADGTFVLHNVFGHSVISVGSGIDGPVVGNVSIGGTDVTDSGVDLPAGARRDNVLIRLVPHRQQLTGIVRRGPGRPDTAVVLLFATDRAKWAHPEGRYLRITKASIDGKFEFGGIPAGSYHLVAIPELQLGPDLTTTVLTRLSHRARRVELQADAISRQDIDM